jgi:hypothetical protein
MVLSIPTGSKSNQDDAELEHDTQVESSTSGHPTVAERLANLWISRKARHQRSNSLTPKATKLLEIKQQHTVANTTRDCDYGDEVLASPTNEKTIVTVLGPGASGGTGEPPDEGVDLGADGGQPTADGMVGEAQSWYQELEGTKFGGREKGKARAGSISESLQKLYTKSVASLNRVYSRDSNPGPSQAEPGVESKEVGGISMTITKDCPLTSSGLRAGQEDPADDISLSQAATAACTACSPGNIYNRRLPRRGLEEAAGIHRTEELLSAAQAEDVKPPRRKNMLRKLVNKIRRLFKKPRDKWKRHSPSRDKLGITSPLDTSTVSPAPKVPLVLITSPTHADASSEDVLTGPQ